MAQFRWTKPPTQAWRIRFYKEVLRQALLRLMQSYAPRIEAQGKRDAPWTDRTGNARQSLAAFGYSPDQDTVALAFRQWMAYGIYLELANGGKYAIILPTMEQYYQPVMRDVRRVVA